MFKGLRTLACGAAACSVVAAWASGAWAQASAAKPSDSSTGVALQEVVVTAQRRQERLVDVPIAVTTQSADQLRSSGVDTTLNLQQVVPGLIVNRFGNFTAPAIRGISTRVVGPGAENNVATYVDGFYIANAISVNRSVADIASIEVLKGPQGTLFGRNATGGAILISTREPSHTPTFTINAAAEGLNGHKGDLYASFGLTDTVAVSVTATASNSDGWINNVTPGSQFKTAPTAQRYARLKLLYTPTDKLSFLGWAEYGSSSDATALALSYYAHPLIAGVLPTLQPNPNETSMSFPESLRNIWRGAYLRSRLEFQGATLTSYTGYRKDITKDHLDFDGSTAMVVTSANAIQRYPERTFSEEVNLTSTGDSRLQWVLGAYYYDDHSRVESVLPAPTVFASNTKAWAGYADSTFRVTDQLFLTAGVRYSHEKKDCAFAAGAGAALAPCLGGPPTFTQKKWTPRFVARYEFTPNANVYASYSRGFKSGAFNTGTALNPVQPETITAYEIGAKAQRARWRADAAVFKYDYTNIQYGTFCTTVSPPACPTAGVTVSINAAKSKIYGADGSITFEATDNLTLTAGASYLHARFDSFPGASASAPSNCANPNPLLCPNVSVAQNWSGLQMIRAPDWSANLQANYQQPTALGTFEVSGNVYYVDKYQPNTDSLPCNTAGCGAGLSPRLVSPAHTLVGLTLTWTDPAGHASASLYARNLFDQKYILQTDANGIGDWHIYGEPRVVGVRVGLTY